MKKLLILAGANIHNKVVEAAKELGIYTIVTDYLEESPAKLIADESLMYNIYDVDSLVDWGRERHIDGVIGFCCDPTQRPAQEIAQKLGLPCFGTYQQTLALTSKKLFKRLCKENGVDTIPEYDLSEVMNGKVSYPIIIKPEDSRSSRGVTVCNNAEDVCNAERMARKESSTGNIIVEKYMEGHQDLTISYIVKDGDPILVSIGDRYPGRKEDNLDRQLSCTIQPSRYASMYMEYVNERVIRMIRNLGIQNGPIFMQGFVDGNTVRMYDPGIRYPGNEYERIYKKATGIDIVKDIVKYCVGGAIPKEHFEGSWNLNGLCAIQYMVNVKAGTIAEFTGLDEILRHENVIDVKQKHFIGDVIENTGDARHRAGEISILVERNPKKMADVVRFVEQHLSVISADGENMLISQFDAGEVFHYYGGGHE